MTRYKYQTYSYFPPPGLTAREPRQTVIIVGAGPIGLAAAIDLATKGVACVVLDDNDQVSAGSRAICWSKRSLEILDRIGIGQRMVDKGVTWKIGRTFHGDREVFSFDLLPGTGHKMPAFVNLQQYYVEEYLIERVRDFPDLIDLRFRNRVTGVEPRDDGVTVSVETPDGAYDLETDWLIACDGAKSPVRGMLDLEFGGELFEERFLIADIEMEADFPSERWFWFEPTFHAGQSALLHKQPDDIYRIDLQLGENADPEEEKKPENVIPRIEKVVGGRRFRLDWVSVYTFQCRRLEHFVHGRVIFAGDSAHVVSPFGARGGNSGLQDVDNLGWKLAAVIRGVTGPALLDSYDRERTEAADENIAASSRTTRFMSPAGSIEHMFRDSVLTLAGTTPFARFWANSGRLSTPCTYTCSGPDDPRLPAVSRPGTVAPDAPIGLDWLVNRLGVVPVVLSFGTGVRVPDGVRKLMLEPDEILRERYLGHEEAATYLVRPDQVIAARWRDPSPDDIEDAVQRMWEGRP